MKTRKGQAVMFDGLPYIVQVPGSNGVRAWLANPETGKTQWAWEHDLTPWQDASDELALARMLMGWRDGELEERMGRWARMTI